jgi:hypothetical protein
MSKEAIKVALLTMLESYPLRLISVDTEYVWENKRPTKEVSGTKYTVFSEDLDSEKVHVYTGELTPAVDKKTLSQVKAEGKHLIITFDGLNLDCYFKNNALVVNGSADKATIKK